MKNFLKKTVLWPVMLSVSLMVACGGGGDGDTSTELLNSGWTKFEAGDYSGALSDFNAAISENPDLGEAYTGLGWCNLNLDQLSAALTNFGLALSNGETNDANAGKAFGDLNLGAYGDATDDVDAVVTITGNSATSYVFSHASGINQDDLLWIKARAHFLLGEYSDAQSVLDVLDSDNGLDPLDPSYVEDLANAIELLRDLIL